MFRRPVAFARPLAVLGLLAAGALQAQPVYRIVGPDGRITFSDRPPVAEAARAGAATPATAGAALPYELAQVSSRYPVTLYTGASCSGCDAGRTLLTSRGIPFTERTVSTSEDVEALQRLSGDTGLPLLTIGSQQIKGYADVEWSQYLDAAGYPRESQLPAGYRRPAPTPLVVSTRANPAATAPAGAASATGEPTVQTIPTRPRPTPAPRSAEPDNPAGIRF